jgi:hypothetical protein
MVQGSVSVYDVDTGARIIVGTVELLLLRRCAILLLSLNPSPWLASWPRMCCGSDAWLHSQFAQQTS